MRRLVALVALVITCALPAAAQRSEARPEERRTVIDFEAEVIEGGLDTPDVVVTPVRKRAVLRSLIRVRTEFRQQLLSTVGHLGT